MLDLVQGADGDGDGEGGQFGDEAQVSHGGI